MNLVLLSLTYLVSVFIVAGLHEFFHFGVAKLLGYSPHIRLMAFKGAMVVYENHQKPSDNLLIAGLSPLLLVILGYLMPNNVYFLVLKILCLVNIFNLLPISSDGEIILLSIIQMISVRKKNGKK